MPANYLARGTSSILMEASGPIAVCVDYLRGNTLNPHTNTYLNESEQYQRVRRAAWNDVAKHSPGSWGGYYRRRLQQIYGLLIPGGARVLEIGCAHGDLLASLKPSYGLGVDFSPEMIQSARSRYPELDFQITDVCDLDLKGETFDFIILSDVVNDLWDVYAALTKVSSCCGPRTRIIINIFSHLWERPLAWAQWLGIATPTLPQNWLTTGDLGNLLRLSGYEPLRCWPEVVAPLPVPGAGIANRVLAKIAPFRWFAMTNCLVARPAAEPSKRLPSVSVVVAARNESGHIDELMARIPEMGAGTEIIFVEGNSTDDTFEVIERVIAENPHRNCKLLKQSGKGKGDAVRAGFAAATGDVLMILDADISVPPEDLPRFYEVLVSGRGEFANGVRLVYPMQDQAMRFANLVGNKFFAWAFSWLLGQPIRDTLCGTKVMWKAAYERISANRSYFGEFDPFGDFDLLFGAAKLNLKIMEVPIRYRARRYGETNISRWRHGLVLLRMVMFAARRIKFV
jgi:SAM-dependent methyltransferase